MEPDSATDLPDTIARIGQQQAQWRRIDALLRHLLAQLAREVGDRNAALAATLSELRLAVADPQATPRAAPLLDALTEAVRTLDAPGPPPPVSADATASLPDAAPLLALLDRLRLGQHNDDELQFLRQHIATCTDTSALCRHGETLAALIALQLQQLEQDRRAAERLLYLIDTQLAALADFVEHGTQAHADRASARRCHDDELADSLQALGEGIRTAPDLAALQTAALARLATIAARLQEVRAHEKTREQDWQQQVTQMRTRIRQLEQNAKHMQSALEKRRQLNETDTLTGLANRRALDARMQALRTTPNEAISLLMLDIDHFKHINDHWGHTVGDRALRIVAEQLLHALRPGDFLARYGGEEFVAVLQVGADEALQVAERLRARIEQISFQAKDRPVHITLSCGVATLRDDDDAETLLERADQALYRAKQDGRNRCAAR